MKNKLKYLLITAFITIVTLFSPPKAKALDPVTIAVLTPVAIEGAKVATPYVLRGLASGGRQFLKMTTHMTDLVWVPIGVSRLVLLDFGGGVSSIGKGITAPIKMTIDALLLPISFMGINM